MWTHGADTRVPGPCRRNSTRVLGSISQILELAPRLGCARFRTGVFSRPGDRAAAMAAKRNDSSGRPPSSWSEYHFYGALAPPRLSIRLPEERRELLRSCRHLRLLMSANCPDDDVAAALVRAEIARLEQRELGAQRLCEHAIESAGANGFVNIEALANELAGRSDSRQQAIRTNCRRYSKEARSATSHGQRQRCGS